MTKSLRVKTKKKIAAKIEIHPDAQCRFENAVDAAVKSGSVHRKSKLKSAD